MAVAFDRKKEPLKSREERIVESRRNMSPDPVVLRAAIRVRVEQAAEQLLAEALPLPLATPTSSAVFRRIAEENLIPIRHDDIGADPVAYTIFIRAHAPEAYIAYQHALDYLVDFFRAPGNSLPMW